MLNSSQRFCTLRVFPGHIVPGLQSVEITVPEYVTTRKVLKLVLFELEIQEAPEKYELVEVCVHDDQSAHGPVEANEGEEDSEEDEKVSEVQTTERVLSFSDNPVRVCQSWRKMGSIGNTFRLFLREKHTGKGPNRFTFSWMDCHESVRSGNDRHFPFDVHSNFDDDDLCQLPDLNEQTLLDKLFERFERGKIYTYVGEILIAVNPYKFFPIYNPKYINAYQSKRLGDLQPHIFAIADEAFQNMLKERKDQCVVISGESGSGKTESTKLLLHHLTALSHKAGMETTSVEKTILGAGPVLEAFGNSKTASNNNSSRFGKFTEVKFREDGTVSGAILRKYLLEKSRIVSQAVGERNYHVFYYLLAGANEVEAQEFHLKTSEFYSYLNKTGCIELEGVDEAYEFLRLKQSMDMVGFTSDIQRKIFRVLSAVLLMGNLEFVRKHSYDDAVTLKEKDGGDEVLSTISNLLMLKKEKFVSVLTSRKKKTRTEQIVMSYKLEEAVDTRDALAKALYGALFDWIVLQVNHTLAMRYTEKKEMKGNSIGVLDIFGFEVFQHNSFEQFCINYANEKLQFYFNHHIFRMEQDEYKAEGISWYNVNYVDNSSCLDLIHAKPTGLFQLLDEESGLSGNVASDTTLLAKFQRHHAAHRSFETSLIEPTFTIVHYAGKVTYDIKDFRAKNKDLMRPEIVSILKNSQMRFIRELLGADPMAIYRWAIVRNYFRAVAAFQKYGKKYKQDNQEKKGKTPSKKESPSKVVAETTVIDEQYVDNRAKMIRKASKMVRKRMKSVTSPEKDIERIRKGLETKKDMSIKTFDYLYRTTSKRKASLKNPPTVTAQFQLSLNRLMEILDESKPFFVRCIRSNAEKAALEFTKELVLSQLRYTGMLETIRIRKLGYHIRFQYCDFHTHFGLLLPRGMKTEDLKENLGDIFSKLGLEPDHFRLGHQKVFFREQAYHTLMTKMDAEFCRRVTVLQGWFRTIHLRKQFLQKRAAARLLQERYRETRERQILAIVRDKAAIKIQAAWRMHVALWEYRRKVKNDEERRRFTKPKSSSSNTSPKRHFLRIVSDGETKAKSPKKMERLRKTLSLQIARSPTPKDFGVTTSDGPRPKSLSLSPRGDRSPIDRNGEQLGVVKESETTEACSDREKRTSQSSSDLTSEICRRFPELADEIRYATVPRSHKEEDRLSPRLPPSPEGKENVEQESENDNEVVLNGDASLGKSEVDSEKSPVFEKDGVVPPSNETTSVNRRLNRRRASSLRGLRKRLSQVQVQRSSTIGIGDSRNSSDDVDDTTVNEPSPRDRDDEHDKDKDPKCSANVGKSSKKLPFFRRNRKEKVDRRSSEPIGPNEPFDYKRHKRHSEDRLLGPERLPLPGPEIESPRGARQLKGDKTVILEGSDGLEEIDKFLCNKIHDLDKETTSDKVFKKAVQEFHSILISTYSVMMKQNDSSSITAEDLLRNFENILNNIIKVDKIHANFPVAVGLNAFHGLLNEFRISRSQSGPKAKKNKRKPILKNKKKKQDIIEHGGHSYALIQFNIHTFCEHCNSMIWILEKGLVCKECKFTCHKRCYKKIKIKCGIKDGRKKSIANASVFGNNLCALVSDDIQIPTVVARLINEIENKGLFSEGIYRKSPSAVQVKQLRNSFSNAKDVIKVDLGVYAIHVIAGVLKLFFRTLPGPLITAESYDEFLRACDLSDSEARLQRFHTLIDTLPKANQDTLERLIFHLARVAKYEESNLMSPSGLSVIWAPCLMRPREGGSALDGLYDIRKQSMIVESLIVGQMVKIDATLVDILKIDQNIKNITAKSLRLIRRKGSEDELTESEEQQRKLLSDQLEKLDKQKAMLTANLSSLTPHSSLVFDEDNSTDSDNCTGDELDGEKKDRQEKNITEEQDKDVSEDKQENGASGSQSGPSSEQPSTEKTNSKERRQSKTKVKTNLPKHYMDSSDSQESLDSVT